jgi:hypothetical protein
MKLLMGINFGATCWMNNCYPKMASRYPGLSGLTRTGGIIHELTPITMTGGDVQTAERRIIKFCVQINTPYTPPLCLVVVYLGDQ